VPDDKAAEDHHAPADKSPTSWTLRHPARE
jgi:hypothetical protein